jgi:hypothetical protein
MDLPAAKFKTPAHPKKISEQQLRPLIDWAKQPGRKVILAAEMSAAANCTITRQQVSKWLHPEAKQRIQPLLGFGVLLLAVGHRLMGVKRKSPKRG